MIRDFGDCAQSALCGYPYCIVILLSDIVFQICNKWTKRRWKLSARSISLDSTLKSLNKDPIRIRTRIRNTAYVHLCMYTKDNFIDFRHRVQHDGEPESSAIPGWPVRQRREAHRFVVPMGLFYDRGLQFLYLVWILIGWEYWQK